MWRKRTARGGGTESRDRSERAVWAATGSLGLLFAFIAFRPAPSFEQELARLGQSEQKAITAWQAIVADAGIERLTDPKIADRIEREVLPAWREARGQIAALRVGSWSSRVAPQLPEAFRLREEAWVAMIAAARTGDPAQTRRAEAAWVEAERLIAEIRAKRP